MFYNIGKKIMSLSICICWVGVISSAFTGLLYLIIYDVFIGLIIVVAGFLSSWIGSWVLYAFGEVVDNQMSSRKLLKKITDYLVENDEQLNKDTNKTVSTEFQNSNRVEEINDNYYLSKREEMKKLDLEIEAKKLELEKIKNEKKEILKQDEYINSKKSKELTLELLKESLRYETIGGMKTNIKYKIYKGKIIDYIPLDDFIKVIYDVPDENSRQVVKEFIEKLEKDT